MRGLGDGPEPVLPPSLVLGRWLQRARVLSWSGGAAPGHSASASEPGDPRSAPAGSTVPCPHSHRAVTAESRDASVSVHSGCVTTYHRGRSPTVLALTEWLISSRLYSDSSGAWKTKIRVQAADGPFLATAPRGGRGQGAPWGLTPEDTERPPGPGFNSPTPSRMFQHRLPSPQMCLQPSWTSMKFACPCLCQLLLGTAP